jgi:hypothetical protein
MIIMEEITMIMETNLIIRMTIITMITKMIKTMTIINKIMGIKTINRMQIMIIKAMITKNEKYSITH